MYMLKQMKHLNICNRLFTLTFLNYITSIKKLKKLKEQIHIFHTCHLKELFMNVSLGLKTFLLKGLKSDYVSYTV